MCQTTQPQIPAAPQMTSFPPPPAAAVSAVASLIGTNPRPCHGCRQRRLRCDRSRPSCHKCTLAGRACPGYARAYMWPKGVAIRGKMAGRRFGEVGEHATTADTTTAAASTLAPDTSPEADDQDGPIDAQQHQHANPATVRARRPAGAQLRVPGSSAAFTASAGAGGAAVAGVGAPAHATGHHAMSAARSLTESPPSSPGPMRVQQTLTDPLFHDLDPMTQRYLHHFRTRLCKDLSAHDQPGCNPFRLLIPLAGHYKFLLHILVATSAIHLFNITRSKELVTLTDACSSAKDATAPASPGRLGGGVDGGGGVNGSGGGAVRRDAEARLQALHFRDQHSNQAFVDALAAKQIAIVQLRDAIEKVDSIGNDVVLAAVLFFVNFELIHLEKSVWKTHLDGALRIMAPLGVGENPVTAESTPNNLLRDCVITDCLIYHILGSTLASTPMPASMAEHTTNLLPVLERTEASCYLCCPPVILRAIHSCSQLRNRIDANSSGPNSTLADEALQLLTQVSSVNIPAWAARVQSLATFEDLRSREHVASAHRSAACLYILQCFPAVKAACPISSESLVTDILDNLGHVDVNDSHFKATSWPTFIAGAEARDQPRRDWTLKRLLAVWESCPWGYIVMATKTLQDTWALQDRSLESEKVSWLAELKKLKRDCLVV